MLASILDFLFPPQCLSCRSTVPANGTLCLECWQKVRFITDPMCAHCGLPFEFALGKDALCGECLRDAPPYAHARSIFRYDENSRTLVTKLKYADQAQLAAVYGTWLHNFGKDVISGCDAIVPVPLHYWRFIGRRYNQSALLAYALKKRSGLPVLPDALLRTRATKPQPGLTRKQRRDNVKGAFAVPARYRPAIQGKTLLLVDDVMTTSATISECTQTLLDAGASKINVLTLARKAG